jgi:tetratricopeptide (TPR) repeat protein
MKKSLFLILFFSISIVVGFGQGDFQKGVSYYKQGQYSKAVIEFEQIVKDSTDYEPGFRVLGDSYLKLKEYRKAANAFRKAIELKGDSFVSYLGAGIAHFNLGEHGEAVAVLSRGEAHAKLTREQYQLLQTRGTAYFNLGDFTKAISDLEKANSIQRGESRNLEQLGIAYFQIGDYPKAKTYLEQSLALNPDASEAKRFLPKVDYQNGLKALEAGELAKASELFQRLTANDPDDGKAWFHLGLCQLFAKQMDAAERSLLKSAELLSDNWQVHDRLGYVYENKKQYRQSLEHYRKALSLHQDARMSENVKRVQERISRAKQTAG